MTSKKQIYHFKIDPEEDTQDKRAGFAISAGKRFLRTVRSRYRPDLLVPVLILLFVLGGGSVVFYRIGHPPDIKPLTIKSPAVIFPASFLVFQDLAGGSPPTTSTTTVVNADGEVTRQFSSSYTDGTFDEYAGSIAPFSSGLLLSNQLSDGTNISVTQWSEMHAGGDTSNVSPALSATLNNLWNNSGVLDGDLYLVGAHTAYGVFANTEAYNFQEINLNTGIEQTISQIKAIGGGAITDNLVQPKSMNAAQSEISFVMNNVTVNDQAVATPSVVVYNIVTNTFKVTALPPSLSNVSPTDGSTAPMQYAVSADGRLLAYQVERQATVNGIRTTWFTTHVYNTQTGQDIVSDPNTSINLGACPVAFTFSNDDKYLVTCGDTSVTENTIMDMTKTSDGDTVKTLGGGSTDNYSIFPIGWTSEDGLVYVTNTAAQGQTFNAATETAQSINLTSGATVNFPSGLGELSMVLH